MPAQIIHIPAQFVKPLPMPQTSDSVIEAFRDNCIEREAAGIPMLPLPPSIVPSALYQPEDPTDEQLAVMDATDGLFRLIGQHGAAKVHGWVTGAIQVPTPPPGLVMLVSVYGMGRVQTWVKTLAVIAGQPIDESVYDERPADRCLADGCALVNSVCVRCGRDNS